MFIHCAEYKIIFYHSDDFFFQLSACLNYNQYILGVEIVRKALRVPITQIIDNTGVKSADVVDKVLSSDNPNTGYDALNSTFVDMFQAGIIDPTKVRAF